MKICMWNEEFFFDVDEYEIIPYLKSRLKLDKIENLIIKKNISTSKRFDPKNQKYTVQLKYMGPISAYINKKPNTPSVLLVLMDRLMS